MERERHRVTQSLGSANECAAAGGAPPQGAALITNRAWLGVVIESNDN